ncbi:hypothetical protein AHF37_06803 [Paragonimus kellicotti]|nr:hypothetical protein AHF37_06803 [Paragonimus kellicotti]
MDRGVNRRRKFRKYAKFPVSSQAAGPYVIWHGTEEVSFDPVTERNMKIGVPYSENKQRRWELREQLQKCMETETGSDTRVVPGTCNRLSKQPTENNDAEDVNLERTLSTFSIASSESWVLVEFPSTTEASFPDNTSSSRGD